MHWPPLLTFIYLQSKANAVQRTVGGGREDERLPAVNADVPQVIQQGVVGGAPVTQGHELLERQIESTVTTGRHILSSLFPIKYGPLRLTAPTQHQRQSGEALLWNQTLQHLKILSLFNKQQVFPLKIAVFTTLTIKFSPCLCSNRSTILHQIHRDKRSWREVYWSKVFCSKIWSNLGSPINSSLFKSRVILGSS